MSIISLIAAVDARGGLGKNNQLLCHIPADLKHFKETTLGKPIIMGRNTFNSIGKPLPGRMNLVLSSQPLSIEGISWVKSIEEALALTQEFTEIMIIGGAQLYKQTMNLADRIYLTKIHHQFSADVYFPDIQESDWRLISSELRQADEKNPYDLTFMVYEKVPI